MKRRRRRLKKRVKRFLVGGVLIFFLGGVFVNSSFVKEQQELVYASLKEKYEIGEQAKNVVEATPEVEVQQEADTTEDTEAKVEVTDNRTTEEVVWDYLKAAGYSDIQVAGIIGNLYQESGLNPARIESNGEGIGLVQWSFGRKQSLINYASSKGVDWSDLETQLEFLVSELDSKQFYNPYKDTFENPYSVSEATEAFCFGFERPNKAKANLDFRVEKAWEAYYRNVSR